MDCLDHTLTEEEVFERIDRYLHNELPEKEDRAFTAHLLECQACHETLLIQQLTRRISKEYGAEIFPVKEKNHEFVGLGLHREDMKIEDFLLEWPHYSWSGELPGPGRFSLTHQGKDIGLQLQIDPKSEKRAFLSGTLHAPYQPQIRIVKIPSNIGGGHIELIVSLEEKNGKYILSIRTK
jgi:hypothetical protein